MSVIIFLLWVGLSFYIGSAAGKKGRSTGGWFLLSLVASPLLAGIFLLIAGDNNPTPAAQGNNINPVIHKIENETKICPKCAESIKMAAITCRYCGHEYDPEKVKNAVETREKELSMDTPGGRFAPQEGVPGKALCLGCKVITLRSNLLYNEKTDIFYHPQCLPR